MSHRARRADFALLTAVGLAAHLVAIVPYLGFCPDDYYIYAQFVRQFVQHGEVAFNPGQAVYGVTSAAHFWAWSLPLKLFSAGGRETVLLAGKLTCGLYTLAWIAVLAALACRITDETRLRYACVIVPTVQLWPARWHPSGMETALADLAFGGFVLALGARRWGWASLCLGLLHFSRPETLIWVPLWLGFLALYVARSRGIRKVFAPLSAYAASGLLLAGSMLVFTGAVVPQTATAKSKLFSLDPAPLLRMTQLLVSSCAAEILLLGLLLTLCLRKRTGIGDERVWLVAILVMVLCGFYYLRGVSLYTRYISYLYAVPFLACVHLVSRQMPAWRNAVLAVAALSLAQNLVLSHAVVAPATRTYQTSMQQVNRPIAEWLREQTAPGEVIAVADIGLIGYYAERPILDVVGLVSPEMLPLKGDAEGTRKLIEQKQVRYLVNVTAQPGRIPFPGLETFRMELVASYPFEKMFVLGDTMYYEVYRIGNADPNLGGRPPEVKNRPGNPLKASPGGRDNDASI